MKLAISPELQLPIEAVTETFGILAVKRAGKSNAAVVLAEEMFRAGLPWVAIDPKGDWWGIRSSSDGSGPGLPILVLGGLHADVPLEATAGHLVADLVVDQRLTCVLDVSEMSKADQRRFLADFAERLYKRNREPLHVFCEEADEYIPQMVRGDVARLVGAFEQLVKRGGFRGLGITLITQRSASLNKDVLTQVQTLFAMRTTSPQDRKAILGWVVQHVGGAEMVDQLPALESGEAWVFSPHWLGQLVKIRFRRRQTFDSGATPKVGVKARPQVTVAEVDIAALREKMAATIEKAKADDPRELRRIIYEQRQQLQNLEREVRNISAHKTQPEIKTVEKVVEIPVLDGRAVRAIQDKVERWMQLHRLEIIHSLDTMVRGVDERVAEVVSEYRPGQPKGRSAQLAAGASAGVRVPPTQRPANPARAVPSAPADPDGRVTGPQQRILDSLAWLESVRVPQANKTQLALLADASPKSSAYANNLGALRSIGLVDYPAGGVVALTDGGRAHAAQPAEPPTTEALHQRLYAKLPAPQGRILAALIEAYPDSLPRDAVADSAGASSTSSAFANNLGSLRSLGLIDYTAGRGVIALPVLFLEDR